MSLQDASHYKIESSELADWLMNQGADRWWNVDGDPLLTGRLSFPVPSDELAAELRRINRMLLVQDRRKTPSGQGEQITVREMDALVTHMGDDVEIKGKTPTWVKDRLFFLCWAGSTDDWLLVEDKETAERSREDAAVTPSARK